MADIHAIVLDNLPLTLSFRIVLSFAIFITAMSRNLERIDNYELILKLMWQNAINEKDPYKNTQILKEILSLQPYLSSYYEATKEVMKESNYMKKYNIPEFETRK